jgi:hypothetical protein
MDSGYRSPLIDFFRRGEVVRDVRLLAAQGAMAPRAHEQLALLVLLSDDPDAQIAATARATLDALPGPALAAFLARSDVPAEMREFFAARGVSPAAAAAAGADEPLIDTQPDAEADDAANTGGADPKNLSALPIIDKIKLAMKGTREQRAQLVRDPNRIVAAAVLSSPKLAEVEVEAFTRMGTVSEEVLRIIGSNRGWLKNYSIVFGLVRNPKTPPAMSMHLLHRLIERDVKLIVMDRNVPEALRMAARKMVVKALK